MAKKKKNKKIEKETRKVIEAISDLVKKKKGSYKFKAGKRKQIKNIKKTCMHWIIRGGNERPSVSMDPENPGNFKCEICGKSFPIRPLTFEEYDVIVDQFEAIVNQAAFFSVRLGGSAEDTKMLLSLKKITPRFKKIVKNEMKVVNKRQEYEERKSNSDSTSQFGNYASYSYK